MCGWCYGFQPELEALLAKHPEAKITWVMGGLAPDTTDPMDDELKKTISAYWFEIEKRSQVAFNHDFWTLNTPFRSTFQACRAVIVSEAMNQSSSQAMAKAIQHTYYQQAKNPSLDDRLASCAESVGLNKSQFLEKLKSPETEQYFQQHLAIARQLKVTGFPALFYIGNKNQAFPLTLGFCQYEHLVHRLEHIRASEF